MPPIEKHSPGSFCWFELGTTNPDGAKEFYKAVFGWAAVDYPMGPDGVYTMLQLDGRDAAALYGLNEEMQKQGVPPNWMVYISVENAEETALRVGDLGGRVVAPPFDVMTYGRMAVLQDPTGALFSLWEPKDNIGTTVAGVDGTACWVDLNTADPEKAAAFYEGLFGWTIKPGEHDPSGYLHIQNGSDYIGGIPPAGPESEHIPAHWLTYFLTSNCDATAEKVTEAGGKFHLKPMTIQNVGRMAVIGDPQGAVFAIFQDKSTL